MTFRSPIPAAEMTSSVMPSAKSPSLGSGLKLKKGEIAILFVGNEARVVVACSRRLHLEPLNWLYHILQLPLADACQLELGLVLDMGS